jgi:hypothetical protein
MGFDQNKTKHHFRLLPDGGAIEITANDPADAASRDAIRQHLTKIQAMFQQGDFTAPTAIHGQNTARRGYDEAAQTSAALYDGKVCQPAGNCALQGQIQRREMPFTNSSSSK